MTPRTDPETRPSVVPVQVIRRRRTDLYGNERDIRGTNSGARLTARETRNGLPEPCYRYRGTGNSVPELDEQWSISREEMGRVRTLERRVKDLEKTLIETRKYLIETRDDLIETRNQVSLLMQKVLQDR